MSEKAKSIHNAYCNYEIRKAKSPSKTYAVRSTAQKSKGIVTSGLSKAMLARQIAAIF